MVIRWLQSAASQLDAAKPLHTAPLSNSVIFRAHTVLHIWFSNSTIAATGKAQVQPALRT